MTALVSMIRASWGSPEKAVIEVLVVGIIATLVTDLWQRLLQIVGVPPAKLGTGGSVAGMDAARRVRASANRCDAFDSRRTRDRVGLSLRGGHCLCSSLLGNNSLGARFWADAHLRTGVRDRTPRCTVVLMQPALGLGFFAARTPHPSVTRIINISGHAVFGVGLYLGAISISFL